MENELKDIKVILAYLLSNEPWSEAEMLYLQSAKTRLGIRTDNKRDENNLNRTNTQ